MQNFEKVRKLTGEDDIELINIVIEKAEQFVKGYTNRTKIPDVLEGVVFDLSVIAINRMGTEGETSRSEGGATYAFDTAPKQVYDILNKYRLARVGGHAFEKK